MKIYCARRGEIDGKTAAYTLLRLAFSREYPIDFPVIEKTPNGKPFFPERPDIHFSISHSKTHVLCALSDRPVGADIESQREIGDRAIAFFATPGELSMFEPLDLWVLKESYVKLLGGTLPMVRRIKFGKQGDDPCLLGLGIGPCPPGQGIASYQPAQGAAPSTLFRLYKIDGCPAAVATPGAERPGMIELVELTDPAAQDTLT